MNLIGMDIEAVRTLARQLDDAAGQLEAMISSLTASLSALEWTGPDADFARTDWEAQHEPLLRSAGGRLRDCAQALLAQADEQVAVSEVRGGVHLANLVPQLPEVWAAGQILAGGLIAANTAIGAVRTEGSSQLGASPPLPPSTCHPGDITSWWRSLDAQQRAAVERERPEVLGGLDGLPGDVRDRANRILLQDSIRYLTDQSHALQQRVDAMGPDSAWERWTGGDAVRERLQSELDAVNGRLAGSRYIEGELDRRADAQLLLYDSAGDGRAALAYGRLDTADHIGVVVPGMSNDLSNYNSPAGNAQALLDQVRLKYPDVADRTAVVAWLGYDTPSGDRPNLNDPGLLQAVSDRQAREGAPNLVRFLDGVYAAREGPAPHTTVHAHSYGTLLTGIASKQGLPADDITLVGSPGVHAQGASEFSVGADHVWTGRTTDDPIRYVFASDDVLEGVQAGITRLPPPDIADPHGPDPSLAPFGARRLDVSDSSGHSQYYKEGSVSLSNMADVLVGRYESVRLRHE